MDRTEHNHASYRMYLLGPFEITDDSGRSLTPRSQKAQAILAMLALSRRGSRSRVWLRDKLWSDRSEDQAAASLRQALLEIRKALGPARDVLLADKNTVWLDTDRITLDLRDMADRGDASELASEHLLEGMDIRDPEFEDWLTLERQNWQSRLDKGRLLESFQPKPVLLRESSDHSTLLPITASSSGDGAGGEDLAEPDGGLFGKPLSGLLHRWLITLHPPTFSGSGDSGRIIAFQLHDLLTRSLGDDLGIGVSDHSFGLMSPQQDNSQTVPAVTIPLAVRMHLTFEGDSVLTQIALTRIVDSMTVWSARHVAARRALENGGLSTLHPMIAKAVDRIAQYILFESGRSKLIGEGSLIDAVDAIFRLSRVDLERAEALLQRSLQQWPTGQAYAWLSFIRTFQVGQRFSARDAQIIDEAQAYARRALELEPGNPVSLALVGHVHSFLFGEYDYAAGLFEKAIRLNPVQPLGWDLYAMLHCYVGQADKAVAISRWVDQLVANSRYKYYFDTTRCVSAALAGDYAVAIAAGEEALKVRPDFNSVLRYLVSSHAHADDIDTARRYLERLQAVEADFSITSLRESRYPLLGTEGGQVLIDGLIKAGVKGR